MKAAYRELWETDSLRAVAPVVLAAWQDNYLTPSELLTIREVLQRGPWLDAGARETLRTWLNPEQPPPPAALQELEEQVKRWLQALPPKARRSLAATTAALASGQIGVAASEELAAAMNSLETLLSTAPLHPYTSDFETNSGSARVATIPSPPATSSARIHRLRQLLDGADASSHDLVRRTLAGTEFRLNRDLSTAKQRAQVLHWLQQLHKDGVLEHCYPHGLTSGRDIQRFAAVFESLAMFDLSLVVKFGVQAGLFAGAIDALGTAAHHDVLAAALRGEHLGCFAMTERAHGSDVRSLQTTATYDQKYEAFTIHTPSLAAGKEWIGNAANHARSAVVFAQLHTEAGSQGVHAFIVPIRNSHGDPCPGVRIEDCGTKMGLNGVDNGRLWFDQVRIPRASLLDRFGRVRADGEYESPIPSPGRRFFTMLSTLVGGRIAVAGAANAAAKVGLTIALRYATHRRQFQRADGSERPLLEYDSHRSRLIPRLAASYALTFTQRRLVQSAAAAETGSEAQREVETLAAGIKAVGTWQAIDTLQQCRECCGGQGYLSANRIDALRTDTDVFTTFEGDNTVLLSLVANNLLREQQRKLSNEPLRTLANAAYNRAVNAIVDRNLVAQRDDSDGTLRSLSFHDSALEFRSRSLLSSLMRRILSRTRSGLSSQEAFDQCQDHALAMARAHIEHYVLQSFQRAVADEPQLQPLCALYGLHIIQQDLAWFLENDYLAATKSRAIRSMQQHLCAELANEALDMVAAFAIPESCLGPLADPAFLTNSGLSPEAEPLPLPAAQPHKAGEDGGT